MRISNKIMLPAVAMVAGLIGYFATTQMTNRQSHNSAVMANAASTQVMLRADHASPDTVTVKVGESVQFNSADGKKHNIAIGQGGHDHDHVSSYRSGEFGANEAWRVEIKEPGSYYFHDHYNPEINILVVAYNPSNER